MLNFIAKMPVAGPFLLFIKDEVLIRCSCPFITVPNVAPGLSLEAINLALLLSISLEGLSLFFYGKCSLSFYVKKSFKISSVN